MEQIEREKESVVFASSFEKKQAVDKLIKESCLTQEFYLLLFSSVSIVTLGLILNNSSVVIGGMLLAPVFSPLLIIGLGVVLSNEKIITKNVLIFLKIASYIVLASFGISFLINVVEPTSEILLRTTSNFEYFLIAFIAGVIGVYFWVKPHLHSFISGVIVAVALVPPLSSFGIGLSMLDKNIISGSLMFFIINFIGLILGSILMLSLFGFGKVDNRFEETIEEGLEMRDNKNNHF